jgi:hypothetical protein
MDDDKKLKLIEIFTMVVMGLISKIVEKLDRRSEADKYLTNIVLLHILVVVFIALLSYIISMSFK